MENRKERFCLAVLSGKGGTGKTLISTNLAAVHTNSTYVDCDVEEPNGYLYFPVKNPIQTQVYSPIPVVDEKLCTGCRECVDFCRFQAMAFIGGKVKIFEDVCHSCGGCGLVCPQNAIGFKKTSVGTVDVGNYKGIHVYSGIMDIGKASGVPIIKELLKESGKEKDLVVIDCPPGSACIVMESIKDADYCLLVAEPTIFGAHNLQMIHKLVSVFQKPFGVVLNKCTDSQNPSETYCRENGIPIVGKLDFDPQLGKWNSDGKVTVWESKEYKERFLQIYENIRREGSHEAAVDSKR